jgi:tetratricopeptide (TPR) repeat protein
MDGRLADARRHLELALTQKPWLPRVHEMLGWIALAEHRPKDALRELALERRRHRPARGIDVKLGQAHQQLGELERARKAYRRELDRDPSNAEARDSLAAIGWSRPQRR